MRTWWNFPATAERFRRYIQQPVLTDIRLTFSASTVYDVVPRRPPDLLARRPLVVFGKFRGKGAGKDQTQDPSGLCRAGGIARESRCGYSRGETGRSTSLSSPQSTQTY